MAQYIQKDALVAEIERRIKVLQNNPYENHKTICHLDSLKQSINTLEVKEVQEEPVSDELEEAAEEWDESLYRSDAFKAGAQWQAEQFEKNRLKHCDELTEEQAQIESDFVTQHLKENNRTPTFIDAIEYGKDLQKHQMIKGAVEAKIYNKAYPTEFEIETNTFMQKLKHGDKVKVIVIKED